MLEKNWGRLSTALFAFGIVVMVCEWMVGLSPVIGGFMNLLATYCAWLGEKAGRKADRQLWAAQYTYPPG